MGVGKSASQEEALQRDFAMVDPNHDDDRDLDLVVSAGPTEVSELVGGSRISCPHLSAGGHERCPPG
jgi:hypothetical protein